MNEIATPGLSFVTELTAKVDPPIDVGPTPNGLRRLVPILGGQARGPRLNGTVIPGGVDYQVWRHDDVTEVHARYVIETTTGARVYVETTGLRRAPPDVMRALQRGEPADQALIYFRTVPKFETAEPDLAWLMRSVFLCAGARYPEHVALRFFEVT
jgi:hypothetical protein